MGVSKLREIDSKTTNVVEPPQLCRLIECLINPNSVDECDNTGYENGGLLINFLPGFLLFNLAVSFVDLSS